MSRRSSWSSQARGGGGEELTRLCVNGTESCTVHTKPIQPMPRFYMTSVITLLSAVMCLMSLLLLGSPFTSYHTLTLLLLSQFPARSQIRSLAINWLPEYQLLPHRNITISITVGLVLPGRRRFIQPPMCCVVVFQPCLVCSRGVLMQGRMEVPAGLAGEWDARCKLVGSVVPSHQGLPLYLHTHFVFVNFQDFLGGVKWIPV